LVSQQRGQDKGCNPDRKDTKRSSLRSCSLKSVFTFQVGDNGFPRYRDRVSKVTCDGLYFKEHLIILGGISG